MKEPEDIDDVVTTTEAAEMLGLSERRIRQLRDELGGYVNDWGRLVFPKRFVVRRAVERPGSRGPATTPDLLRELIEEVRNLRDTVERMEVRGRGRKPPRSEQD